MATFGATLTLSGTDIALTASMRAFGHVGLLGLVIAAWAFASLAGGFAYGVKSRRLDPLLLLVLRDADPAPGPGRVMVGAAAPVPPLGHVLRPTDLVDGGDNCRLGPGRHARSGLTSTSALTLGGAAGAPLTGWVIDSTSPGAGFVAIGALGTVLAVTALAARHRRDQDRGHPTLPGAEVARGRSIGRGTLIAEPAADREGAQLPPAGPAGLLHV